MTYGIYRLLTRLIFALTFPVFLVYAGITGKHRAGLRQRLGYYAGFGKPRKAGKIVVWIHGASVGEVMAAKVLADKIKTGFPDVALVLSTVTEQGLQVARQHFGNMADCVLAPLDLPGAVARAAATIRPDIYICLETELWPNLLARLRANHTRLFLLNGRLSERSGRGYRLLGDFTRKILAGFTAIAAITGADAERFMRLGAEKGKVTVTGNSKYDLPSPVRATALRADWRRRLALTDNQPVLIAGSTHTGEEELLVEVFHNLKRTLVDLVLIIAPRHLTRLPEIKGILHAGHAAHEFLSTVPDKGRRTDLLIVDSIGDLAELYAAADFIFCGGSLTPRGGHNIMEAAIWGIPVFYGPSMKDFADARQLLEGHGGITVATPLELAEKIKELYLQPRQYAQVATAAGLTASSQHGAADKQLAPVFHAIRSIRSQY